MRRNRSSARSASLALGVFTDRSGGMQACSRSDVPRRGHGKRRSSVSSVVRRGRSHIDPTPRFLIPGGMPRRNTLTLLPVTDLRSARYQCALRSTESVIAASLSGSFDILARGTVSHSVIQWAEKGVPHVLRTRCGTPLGGVGSVGTHAIPPCAARSGKVTNQPLHHVCSVVVERPRAVCRLDHETF